MVNFTLGFTRTCSPYTCYAKQEYREPRQRTAAQMVDGDVELSALLVLVESCLNRAATRIVRCACK